MANKLISQLTAASSVTGTDLIEIEQSGASKKATLALVLAYVEANLDSITGNLDVGGTLDVSGLASFGASGLKITNSFGGTLLADNLSDNRTFQLPDAAGTLCLDTGSINIATVGTITTGTWSASTVAANKGGTGQTSYTDGQLLIGNSTGNTLTKATLTAGTGISISNGSGSISIGLTNSSITIAGISVNLGSSITATSILDSIGSTRGSVLYRGASGWSILTPGTSGYSLVSNGAGADPSWQDVSGGGGGVSDGDYGDITVSGTGSVFTLNNLIEDSIGTTPSTARLALRNTTAAAAGAQQVSPLFVQEGQGWKTATTAASQSVRSGTWVVPGQAAAAPIGKWNLGFDINNTGTFTPRLSVDSYGAVYINGASTILASGQFVSNAANFNIYFASSTGYINLYGLLIDSAGDGSRLRLGRSSATPSAIPIGGQDGSGTNITGGTMRISGGRGTGTGSSGSVEVTTSLPGSSGTTVHASLAVRSHTEGKATTLTHATATAFAQVSLQTSKVVGGKLIASVCATDGTDWQCLTSDIIFSAVNKSGTITTTVTETHGTAAVSAIGSTLVVTYSVVQNGSAVDIKALATSSLTSPSYEIKWSIVSLNSNDATTVTPQ